MMMHHFGLTSGRTATGISQSVRSHGANTRANSIPSSPDRPSGRALLKRGYVTQAVIDSAAVLFGFLFLISIALSIPLALFLLLFASF
jgi:hypothetical protein